LKRGDIFWSELIPRSGSEQKGSRPVIIVSHDGFNETQTWKSVIVVPLSTSKLQGRRAPTVTFIPKEITGTDKDSFALCHQITTLDRSKLFKYLGSLPKDLLYQVEQGIKASLDML